MLHHKVCPHGHSHSATAMDTLFERSKTGEEQDGRFIFSFILTHSHAPAVALPSGLLVQSPLLMARAKWRAACGSCRRVFLSFPKNPETKAADNPKINLALSPSIRIKDVGTAGMSGKLKAGMQILSINGANTTTASKGRYVLDSLTGPLNAPLQA